MKNKKWNIANSTKLTMIFCGSVVVFSAILLVFLMFFPLKMENPANGINEKLIASAMSTTTISTESTTATTVSSFVNTRKTTDKNHVAVTTFTETVTETVDDDYYDDYNNYDDYNYNDYNDYYNDYNDYNNYNNGYNDNYNSPSVDDGNIDFGDSDILDTPEE